MNNNKSLLVLFVILQLTFMNTTNMSSQTTVTLETSMGSIKIKLYDETPKHKANFLKLVREGYYNGVLFHRVIPAFMIQTGDPNSKNARPGQSLGTGGPDYKIPAEFVPAYFHKKGALAAARQSDEVNPLKQSSGSQFYIVQGRVYNNAQLESIVSSGKHKPFTPEQITAYTTLGGVPHLDDAYTVFGEVVEGFEIIDDIADVATDQRNRPLSDIKIIKASISE
jgi:cyclophilin family peptidyl-prolyl cis-trans isomerase